MYCENPPMSQWYYLKQGQNVGPYNQAQFQQLITSGQIKPQDLIWRAGMAQWLPVQSVPEFAGVISKTSQPSAPQPSSPHVSTQPQPQTIAPQRSAAPKAQPMVQVGSTGLSSQLMQVVSKPVFFGLLGALGCLLGALLAEGPYHLLTPAGAGTGANANKAKVDVMFVLDVTASMGGEIDGVRAGIGKFVKGLEDKDLDVQVGLTYYRDAKYDEKQNKEPEEAKILKFNGRTVTGNVKTFKKEMRILEASGGGDRPESALDALTFASEQKFRDGAVRVLLLITDAKPHIPDKNIRDLKQTKKVLLKNKIRQLHLVIKDDGKEDYMELQKACPGKVFDLEEVSRGQGIGEFLPNITKQIAETTQSLIKSMESSESYSADAGFQLLFRTATWTAILTLCLSFGLIIGQNMYLRKQLLAIPEMLKGSGSLLVGFLAGVLGGGLFFVAQAGGGMIVNILGLLLSWSLLGGIVGVGMTLFVPNLNWIKGLIGGAVGGFAGAVGFLLMTGLLGDIMGRFIGAALLGFCIGLMVALAEVAFRRFWLEVSFGPREIRTVTLGNTGVTIGGDEKTATIFVREAPAIALRYEMTDNAVICEDATTGQRTPLQPGDQKTIGKVTVTVRSATAAAGAEFVLRLSNGKTIPLSDGLPLTAQELPGLQTSSMDGTVALVSKKPADPKVLLLRNRSQQPWSSADTTGANQTVNPGLGIPLQAGTRIHFGNIHGEIVRNPN